MCRRGNRLTQIKQKRDAPGWAHSSQKVKATDLVGFSGEVLLFYGVLAHGDHFSYNRKCGVVAHLVERSIRIAEVVGSSPIYSTTKLFKIHNYV